MKHLVLIGAGSAIAQHCARLWVAREPLRVTLVGRDAARLHAVADDLRVRSPQADIGVVTADFDTPQGIEAAVTACAARAPIDRALIAHGWLADQTACEQALAVCAQALQVNGLSPVLFAEAVARHLSQRGSGTLAVIGSVAGDRGRRSNYVYGAAKALVDRYLQGLQHRFADTDVRVVLIKPGPTDTPMTAGFKAQGRALAPVEQVAADIVRGMDRGQRVVYTPGVWRVIMWVIRHLPFVVFRRLKI